MPSTLYLYLGKLFTAQEIVLKTGIQSLEEIPSDMLPDYNVVRVDTQVQGEPNLPWTYLDGPTHDKKKNLAVYKHTYLSLGEAKTLAIGKLTTEASALCKQKCAEASIDLDPLLLSRLNPEGLALGPLKQELDDIAAGLELSIQAVNEAKTVPSIIKIVESDLA